jgi:arylsulfatase A-like enzyme
VLTLALWLFAAAPAPAAPLAGRSVVVISIDTLRADHLGAYGYPRSTSPNLDALARESVLFERAYSVSPATAPSHMSLLTGVMPSVHRVVSWHSTGERRLSDALPTLATLLKQAGYATHAHTGGGNVHDAFGFDQGFDTFSMAPWGDLELMGLALEDVARRAKGPFFFFGHTYQVHGPYVPPQEVARLFVDPGYAGRIVSSREELERRTGTGAWDLLNDAFWGPVDRKSEADVAHLRNLYDAGIRHMDAQLLGFLQRFRAAGLDRSALLVLTSDHGEEFMEHGSLQHGTRLFEEQLRVPLVVRLPNGAGATRVPGLVRLVDLVPTLLELLGRPRPDHLQGDVLPGLGSAAPRPRPLYFEEIAGGLQGLRTGDLKYIRHGDFERLFDLSADPKETEDRLTQDTAYTWRGRVRQILEANLVLSNRFEADGKAPRLDPETRRQLQALGYIGGAP